MLERIITAASFDYFNLIVHDFYAVLDFLKNYWNEANSLRLISIGLIVFAITIFLLMVIVLYVKSIFAFLKNENKNQNINNDSFDYVEYEDETQDDENDEETTPQKDDDETIELEKELAQELNLTPKQDLNAFEAEKTELKEEPQPINLEKSKIENTGEKKNNLVDLDWKKGKKIEEISDAEKLDPALLKYQQANKSLEDLIALIIDMIGRGVDELKIAQTIMFRNQGKNSEDDILQTITAIKEFITLCVNKKFYKIKENHNLPDEDEALFHLAMGDSSLALALIEALMDENIEYASTLQSGDKRDKVFAETSAYSVTFGTLAALSDKVLATGSFELAVELTPQNLTAWGRLADMYHLLENEQKAIWAYNKVLEMADEELSPQIVANARKILSQYYYAQGNSLQAAKFYTLSKQYYDSIGINRRLDKKEIEIIELIEQKQKSDLENIIAKILANGETRHNFA